MKDYFDHVRSQYRSKTKWIDIDLRWANGTQSKLLSSRKRTAAKELSMKIKTISLLPLAWALATCALNAAEAKPADRPNIVIILADDLGAKDIAEQRC